MHSADQSLLRRLDPSLPIPKFADSTRSDSLASQLRNERRARFLTWAGQRPGLRILDVGGQRSSWRELDSACEVTVVNLAAPDASGRGDWVRGDALKLPFKDQSFDVVFSNSVIEHVGDCQHQHQFAAEVQRVGRRYWVQAPNRYFPIEPHFLFPGFQFLPIWGRVLIGRNWPFSWDRHFGVSQNAIDESARTIRLPTDRELTEMFPGGVLHREMLLGLTKSLTIASPSQ